MDALGLRFADYWDQITPESAGKWYAVQPTPASPYDWTTLDAIFDYAVQNSLIFHESPMIWESSVPSGFTADLAHAWIDAFCDRYPTTPIITVVNEPPPHTKPVYADEMGGNTNGDWKWIVTAFQWAHDACPNAILLLNDYNNIEYASDNANTIDIVNAVKAGGGPIHGVGAQAHDAYRIRTATVKAYMDKIHDETGLPVYITEYDVGLADDAAQLAVYQEQLPVFLETDYVPGITQFGWIEGKTWRSNTGLVREDGSFRPAMTWLMETLRRPRIAQAASKKRPMDR
ncbi:MAG: endo-1,4-beta-xylanase [Polyangiaceae bacterium]|nr:endo-1,4-beta-xylanase [Polyangiaceae bacterium]